MKGAKAMYQIYFSEITSNSIGKNEVLSLELLPDKLNYTAGKNIKVSDMLDIGEISIAGGRKLRQYQINSELRAEDKTSVQKVREIILELSESKEPFFLSIIRKDEKNAELFSDQIYVYLESAEIEEREGEVGSLHYKLKLKEYVRLMAKEQNGFVKIEAVKQ